MNAETEKLLRQLELATSHLPVDEAELDSSTRELRQGWLAFERLMQTPVDQFVEKPTSRSPAQELPAHRLPALARSLSIHWIGAVSVAILVGLFGASFLMTAQDPEGKNLSVAQTENEHNPATATLAAELAWDDSFDHRLAAASLAIRRVGEGSDIGEWHYLSDELMEISDELTGNSL